MPTLRPSLVLAALLAAAGSAHATLQISTPFINFESRAYNSLGFAQGTFFRFGALSVTDTATGNAQGITGVGTTTDVFGGGTVARDIFYSPGPVIPNFFTRNLSITTNPIHPNVYQPWTLTFNKGSESASRVVELPDAARPIGFVNSITLSGSADKPKFTWTPPTSDTIQAYRINIFDRSLINNDPTRGPLSNGQVVSRDITTTSYTINPADFAVPGYGFALGTQYAIEISALQTRDGSTNTNNSNLQSVSRVYADFTPVEGTEQQIQLPVVTIDGAYQFNFAVEAGVTYHIDPLVAVGYDYLTGAGDPNFRTVTLPNGIGDGLYDIWLWDGIGWWLVADDWASGATFDFGLAGVDRFRITDIETSAGLDPADATAFVTSVTFTGAGQFTGTQTPITVDVAQVPEAPIGALLFTGFAAMVLLRPRRQR